MTSGPAGIDWSKNPRAVADCLTLSLGEFDLSDDCWAIAHPEVVSVETENAAREAIGYCLEGAVNEVRVIHERQQKDRTNG